MVFNFQIVENRVETPGGSLFDPDVSYVRYLNRLLRKGELGNVHVSDL